MTTRALVLQLLGEPPLPVPLDLVVRCEAEFPGGRRVRIDYAASESERISAYLLLPAVGPRTGEAEQLPGILAIHQHAGQYCLGKSEPAGLSADPSYHYGLDLCRRGYVVLCPDLLGFEERRPPEFQRAEGTMPDGALYERYLATRLLLEGSSLKARYTFDLARGLDVLQSLELVDPERLGVIGHSLGGQEAFWLAWYDARVRAGVASCGLSTLRSILRDHINHNLAMYLPGLLRVADMDTLAADLAPCPFMLAAGEADPIFPIDGVRQLVAAAQAAYSRAAVPDQFRALIFAGGHSLPQAVREEAYRFLDRWLKAPGGAQTPALAGCNATWGQVTVAT
ncbi:MAG TPA: alpha/beta fold hydrolase [Anaerolineae bacterium]|nr:alpha/beta fold hydrolase [Anaerolineae bacterium]HOQ98356.1 alpha/beta fold hydrolase [Anaerolineae bacterium]HPL26590.1 alpha/beta fold hydrolase [Anaerolineae bacterium]